MGPMGINRQTRAVRAAQVAERLKNGPANLHSSVIPDGISKEARDELLRGYKLWVETWILPELNDLVPELRKAKAVQA